LQASIAAGTYNIPGAGQPLAFKGRNSTYSVAEERPRVGMPSVIKFIVILAVLAGLGYAGLWALANLVEPQPREITVTIPADKLGK
jgi:hypothetical protein